MTENVPDYRPEIWSGVEGATIRNMFVDNGYGEVIRAVDALRGIDTYALGKIAIELYGTSDGAISQIATSLSPGLEPSDATAKIPTDLNYVAMEIEPEFKKVERNWHGPASTEASTYNTALRKVTQLEAYRSAFLGDSIIKFAAAVEEAAEDAEETALGAANLLYAEVGVGVSIFTGGTGAILMSAAGLFGSIIEKGQAAKERHKKEVEETTAATLDIDSKKARKLVRGIDPADLMPDFPDEPNDWKVGE